MISNPRDDILHIKGGMCPGSMYVDTRVGGQLVYGTIDTGAGVSLINVDVFRCMSPDIQMLLSKRTGALRTATGTPIPIIGHMDVVVRLRAVEGGIIEMMHGFTVVAGLNCQCIFGFDFLNQYVSTQCLSTDTLEMRANVTGVSYHVKMHVVRDTTPSVVSPNEHVVHVSMMTRDIRDSDRKDPDYVLPLPSGSSPPRIRPRYVRLTRDVVVPANSMALVPVTAMSENAAATNINCVWVVEGDQELARDGIMVAHSAHSVSSELKMSSLAIQMINTTNKAVKFNRFRCIGTLDQGDVILVDGTPTINKCHIRQMLSWLIVNQARIWKRKFPYLLLIGLPQKIPTSVLSRLQNIES